MRSGQSLIEVLIGLTIGALLIGTAAMGVAFMLRSTAANDNLQMASGMVQASLDKARAFAGANWQNIYGLTKGTSTTYFLNSSSTEFFLVEGKEGVVGTDVMDGLVGRWGFDEATGTVAYDMSGNNNNGTLINSPMHATSTCKTGYCLIFDGVSNYVDVGNPTSLTSLTTGSFSLWFKTSNSALQYLFASGSSWSGLGIGNIGSTYSDESLGWLIYNSGYKLNMYVRKGTGFYADGNWHNVVIVVDGQDNSIYVDGAKQTVSFEYGSTTTTGYFLNAGGTPQITVGRRTYPGSPAYTAGSIDDFRIYNRALSADEIKRMYESGVFSRYFTVENICRTNDASSTVSGVTPCGSGSLEDPSTQKVSSVVEWIANTGATNLTLVDYITRWKNAIFQQTDWSGGSGDDAIYTEPGSGYSSSTNIDGGSGLIRLHGI